MANDFKITVFSKSVCSQCDSTKALLDQLELEYDVINIEETPGALDQLKAAGFRSAPVVVTPNGAWGGHNEDKIRALVA